MKPPGIRMGLSDGAVVMGVTRSSYAEDKIWEAVQEAIRDGWTPKQFKLEAAEAWAQELRAAAEAASKELTD